MIDETQIVFEKISNKFADTKSLNLESLATNFQPLSKISRLVSDSNTSTSALGRNNIKKLEIIYKIKMINVVGKRPIVANKSPPNPQPTN